MEFELTLVVVGVIVGWAGDRFLPALWRRITGRASIDVHVETDPGVFLAGEPNWDAFGYLIPKPVDTIGSPPGQVCRDWHSWALEQGATPAAWSRVRLTLTGHLDATVIVDQIRVDVIERESVRDGTYVRCKTGGADAITRGFSVDLDRYPPEASHVDPGGEPVHAPLALSLSTGEVEILELESKCTSDLVRWTCELAVIVNGKREMIAIDDSGAPFVTAGTEGLTPYVWAGTKWQADLV